MFKMDGNRISVFIFICALSFVKSEENKGEPHVKIVSPVFLREVEDTIKYETTIPLLLEISIPHQLQDVLNKHLKECASDDSYCSVTKELFSIFESVEEELEWSDLRKRNRRFVGYLAAGTAGFFLRPAINKLTGGLFGDGDEWKAKFNELRNSLIEEHQELLTLRNNSVQYSIEVRKSFNLMNERLQEVITKGDEFEKQTGANLFKLNELVHAKMEADEMYKAIESCRNKHVPVNIISPKEFVKHLVAWETSVQKHGYTSAIQPESFSEYLKLPLADCTFTSSAVYVTVSVPIKQINNTLTLYEMIPVKFQYEGQVCELYPQDASFRAKTKEHVVLITHHLLPNCNAYEHKLCFIPPYAQQSSQALSCAVGILKKKTVKQLYKSCSFRCSQSDDVVIAQMNSHTLFVTNAKNISVNCNGKISNYTPQSVGAKEIHLTCRCQYTINGNALRALYPCVDKEIPDDLVFQSIPVLWTTLDKAVGTHSTLLLTDHYGILRDNWTMEMPIFNLSIPEFFIPEAVEEGWDRNTIWLSCLSGAVGLLLLSNFTIICLILR